MKVLTVSDLHKKYNDKVAVDGVSFDVRPGEIVGLLGPNGAGKTTVINMILGVLEPSEGAVRIEDIDLTRARSRALEHTNFAAAYSLLPGNLTVFENLYVFGLLYGVKNLQERIRNLLKQFDLEAFRNTKSGVLSSGEQTRLCLAKAMLNHPRLLLLDEPTVSLDPSIARDIRAKIRDLTVGGAVGVLWASHNMYEVQDVCDRVLFLAHGKILLEGNPEFLPAEYGKSSLEELFIAVACEPLSLQNRCSQ